ncbi:MAG TPA: hypothetical protein VJL89_07605 [Thermodesulfovibrionia bacterium]|nr:hypothetical protein [Thermodesulfovibrionia bacterium]
MPANNLNDVFRFFYKQAHITVDNFDEFYVNADKGRGKTAYTPLKRQLVTTPDGSLKILFAGHKGCGKSTELVRLQKSIDNDFVVLSFSVRNELDINNINYIELLIVAMERLFGFVNDEHRMKISSAYLKNITNWLRSEELEKINNKHLGIDLETGAEAGFDIPFITKFFAKFKAAAKASVSMKETLKMTIEPKLTELILNCNLLINEIKNSLSDIGKKGLVIIMEDLDKLSLSKSEEIFFDHSAQLNQLNCHCIFTFPIALQYHIKYKTIRTNYDEAFVLPMIKVATKQGNEVQEGIQVMKDIVSRRMDISLFEDEEILKDMIKYSGGCLWDLFQIIKDAVSSALDYERDRINRIDFTSAYKILKRDYEFTIAENTEKKITVHQYFDALVECANDRDKKPMSTDVMFDLRNNLTVLSYNDENWNDVHPVVKDILKERRLIYDE